MIYWYCGKLLCSVRRNSEGV